MEIYNASRSGDGSSGAVYSFAAMGNFDDWTYTFSTNKSNSVQESMTVAYYVSDGTINRVVDGSSTEKIDSETDWEDHASGIREIQDSEHVNETTGYDAYGTVHREIDSTYNATITTNFDGHAHDESHSKAVTTWDSTGWSSDVTIEKKSDADYTFSEKEEGTSSSDYAGWMSNGSGGWSASENWDESGSSDWNKKFTQHEDYSATLNYSYTIDQTGIRSNELFKEQIKGSGEIDRTSNANESLNEEHSFSEGSWSGYASRYTKQDTQTKLDDKTSNTYNFDVSRSSLTDTLTPENHLDSSRHSTKTVSGEYYRHNTFGGGGSPGGSETITDPLHDYAPIDEDHSETNSSPGFANQNSLPKLMKPLTTDGATGGIKGNYPAASTDSPPGSKSVKVDISLINKGTPSYGNFAIPDMEAALNPLPLPEATIPAGISVTTANSAEEPTLLNRVFGVLQVIGGVAQTAVGSVGVVAGIAGSAPTMGGSVVVAGLGGVVAGNGLDNVQAGLRQAISGKPVQTATSSAVEAVTGSHLAGEGVNLAVGLVGPGTVAKMATGSGLIKSIKSVAGDAWGSIKSAGTNIKNWWKGTPKATFTNPINREALEKLALQDGFINKKVTAGGYVHYQHPDGREIFIRPNGEVGYLGKEIVASNGKKYRPRMDGNWNRIESHNTGIFVEPNQ